MAQKSFANFKEKLTCGLKKDLANFHQSTWKCQNWDFDGKIDAKFEGKVTCALKNEGFGKYA